MKNYKSILATLFSAVLLFVCSCSNNTSLKTKVKMSFPVQNFYSVLTARGVEQDSVTINLDVDFYVDNTLYASQSKLVDQNKTSESFIFNGIEFGSTVYAKAEVKSVTVRDGKTYENQMLYGESETITVETEFVELPLTLRWVENQEEKPIQIEVTTSKLKSEIQNYIPGIKTIYKVKGQMTNSEFSELQELIENKSDNDWGGEYVGLDLSEVTGLTRIDYTWGFISLTIPSSVTEFGNYAQFDCVKILDGNPNFKYVDGVLYSADKTSLYFYPKEKTNTVFEIPSGVKKIQSAAFLWNNNIQSITIPESVVFIGMAALQTNSITQLTFKNKENWYNDENRLVSASDLENPASYSEGQTRGICRDGLFKPVTKTVTFSQLQTEINSFDGQTFTNYKVTGSMSNDDYIQINKLINDKGNNEKWIGSIINLDLSGVTGLTTINYVSWPIASVTLPKTFSGVEKNTDYLNIIVTADNPYFKYVDGNLYSADETVLYYYSSENTNKSFEIPSGVKKIWRFAFYNNKNIQNITIPESVVDIGWAAFDNDDTNIQTLTFKNKENWMANNNSRKVNPDDLEKVENFRWNSDTQTTGIFRHGLYKQETKTVTFAQMMTALNSYEAGTYTIYKVTGEMTNSDYSEVFSFIWDKVNYRKWEDKYVGINLSEVTGLTQIGGTWCFSTVIIPATVTEASNYSSGNIVGFESNPNFKYEDEILYTKDGTILCCYSREKTDKSFEIPSSVTKIWNSAFCNNYYIESITVPESVVYIGDCAFDNSNIQTLTFKDKENWMHQRDSDKVNPEDLENPANYRWNDKTESNGICRNGIYKIQTETINITANQLADTIRAYVYKEGVFTTYKVTGEMSNEAYTEIVNIINNKRNYWNNNTLYIALDLSSVTGLTTITNTWSLRSLVIPDSVGEINEYSDLSNITISENNPYFEYDSGILYSKNKTTLYLYPQDKEDESFTIPSTVTKIWAYAFRYNTNIKTITIPESVIYIGADAFRNQNIQTLTFKNKDNWKARHYYNNTEQNVTAQELENVQNYQVDSQTGAGGLLQNCLLYKPKIETVTFAQMMTALNSYEAGTYTIYKVTGEMTNSDYSEVFSFIWDKVNYRKWEDKYVGIDLSEVTGLTQIGGTWCFSTVTIPDTVTEASDYSSGNIIGLESNPNFKYEDGVLYTKDGTVLCYYPREKTDESFEIPSSVTKIWSSAFCYNYYIENITIPESVVYIGDCTFDNSNIQTLTFKDKENWMVRGNNNSVSKANPDDLENPANYRWNNQTQTNGLCRRGLIKKETKTVTVSQLESEFNSYNGEDYIIYKVTGSMSNDYFSQFNEFIRQKGNDENWYNSRIVLDLSGVTGLTKIDRVGWPITSLILPDTVSAFGENAEVYKVVISSTNPYFKINDGILYSLDETILYSCSSEKSDESVEILSTVTKIWSYAFYNNLYIKNIIIPESVVYIGAWAFDNSNIQTLTFENKDNWMTWGNDNSASFANPDELENAENYKWNYQTQTNGIFRRGLFKPETKTVAISQLTDEIDSYAGGDYIIYKVTGEMSNEDYSTIVNLINNKWNNSWNDKYVGLDLSAVTGLSEISYSWCLFSLAIPSSVSELNISSGVGNIIVSSDNTNFKYVEGVLYSADGTILYRYPNGKTNESFVIPSTVKKICAEAFQSDSIQNITVSESVVYIGANAFGNSNIQTLTFENKENWLFKVLNDAANKADPDALENPANYRWNNQTQTNGIFRQGLFKPESVTVDVAELTEEIDSYAGGDYIIYKVTGEMSNAEYSTIVNFINDKRCNSWNYNNYVGLDLSEVTGLTEISNSGSLLCLIIPSSVTKLNNYVGAYNIIITSDNTHFKYVEGVFYSADETILYLYPKDKTDSSFVIPSTVTMIWCEAFWVNDSIQNITVPESVVYIGSGAFDNGNIQTLTFKDKQNWMARGNNNSASPANPDDLENPANHRWNNRTQINGIFRQGLFKPETKNIAAEDLQNEINSFAGGNYIMYKVTGSMSNDEFIEIIRLLDQKRSNTWNYERYVGLDLSSVTGLTSAGNTDSVFYIVLPDSVQ